jgi:hypothetical protein
MIGDPEQYIKIASRFFVQVKIPNVANVSVNFIYNYFVPDESVVEDTAGGYNKRFGGTSYNRDKYTGEYLYDDQGDKLLIDSDGTLISADSLHRRAPRVVELFWEPPFKIENDSIEHFDNDHEIIYEEEISSIFDTSIKIFDPRLKERLINKVHLAAMIGSQAAYWRPTVNGTLMYAATNTQRANWASYYGWLANKSETSLTDFFAELLDLLDMNSPAEIPRVNDFGEIMEPSFLDEAQSYLMDIDYDRRMIQYAASNHARTSMSHRSLLSYTNKTDANNKLKLPLENTQQSFHTFDNSMKSVNSLLETPCLKAKIVNDKQNTKDAQDGIPSSKFLHIGYIVDRFPANSDINLDSPQKRFYVDGGSNNSLIDTAIKYGGSYYYTIRSVFMRDFFDYDLTTEKFRTMRQYYASKPSEPVYVSCVERIPPNEPDGVFYKFNYKGGRGLFITWQYPVGRSRDTKYFQIFKRSTIYEPFTCIAELDFDDSVGKIMRREKVDKVYKCSGVTTFFEDTQFSRKSTDGAIYAIAAIDAHGLTSGYSAQTRVKFNKSTNKIDLTDISRSGAPKQYPNFFVDPIKEGNSNVRTFTQDLMKSSGKQRVKIYLDPDCEIYQAGPGGAEGLQDYTALGLKNDNIIYKMHFINLDRQKDDSLEIIINDFRSG